jgi:hypothetical protein
VPAILIASSLVALNVGIKGLLSLDLIKFSGVFVVCRNLRVDKVAAAGSTVGS